MVQSAILPGGMEFLLIFLVIIFLFLIPFLLYVRTLVKTMKVISLPNRQITPKNLWLLLIPVLGYFYLFYAVIKIADSLNAEYTQLGLTPNDFGKKVGLIMCSTPLLASIDMIAFIAVLAGFVCWIMHWSKMSRYKNTLLNSKIGTTVETI